VYSIFKHLTMQSCKMRSIGQLSKGTLNIMIYVVWCKNVFPCQTETEVSSSFLQMNFTIIIQRLRCFTRDTIEVDVDAVQPIFRHYVHQFNSGSPNPPAMNLEAAPNRDAEYAHHNAFDKMLRDSHHQTCHF
jgi:hypothetical protein